MRKNIYILALLLGFIFFQKPVFAGTLSCTVRTSSCNPGEVKVMGMYATSNSHAELASQTNYSNFVCCGGVTGLTNSCSGTFATVAKLYSSTNSHVEQNSQSLYPNSVCLSVPSGGSVSIGYQASNCTGFDTTIASMSGVTNAHVGDSAAFSTKICGTASGNPGVLSIDIVDGTGSTVPSPLFTLSSTSTAFNNQTATGTLGSASQKIRVTNSTANTNWAVSIAATSGPTAVWTTGSFTYDYNDPATNGGKLTINPSVGTSTPQAGCNNNGITLGASTSFSQGTIDSIGLLTSSATTPVNCYWDFTGATLSQLVPKQQQNGTYTLNLTVTVVAY